MLSTHYVGVDNIYARNVSVREINTFVVVVVVVVWEGHDVVMREHRSTPPAAHTEAIRACKKRNSLYRPLDYYIRIPILIGKIKTFKG